VLCLPRHSAKGYSSKLLVSLSAHICVGSYGTDEDITLSDAPAVPTSIMQGPMTRARKRQLNLEVSSFLSDSFHTFENRLLPNDVILIRNIGEGHEELKGSGGGDDDQPGRPIEVRGPVQHDFESASASRTSLP
jgi:hypothetical protein